MTTYISRYRFYILISLVFVSGFSQGMMLPVLAILLEKASVSSSLNGLNATAIYLGILIASPFIEKPIKKLGFKPVIAIGLLPMVIAMLLFPFVESLMIWFLLRLWIGIGDNMLHLATQVWLTQSSTSANRGKNLSLYGMAFGLGFGLGPLTTRLLSINDDLPFYVTAVIGLIALLILLPLKNAYPKINDHEEQNGIQKYFNVFKIAWIAFLPPLGYGFLEATLNATFPIYALRTGLTIEDVSIILPAFVVGSLLFQLPLGHFSDRFGRALTLRLSAVIGFAMFFLAIFTTSPLMLAGIIFVAGMAVGSFYSLGIAYVADLLPPSLIPAGNILAGICFGVGSLSGPIIAGWFIEIELLQQGSVFIAITSMMLLILIGFMLHKTGEHKRATVKISSH